MNTTKAFIQFQNFFSAYLGQLDGLINDLKNGCAAKSQEKNAEDEDQWNKLQNSFKIIEICGKW